MRGEPPNGSHLYGSTSDLSPERARRRAHLFRRFLPEPFAAPRSATGFDAAHNERAKTGLIVSAAGRVRRVYAYIMYLSPNNRRVGLMNNIRKTINACTARTPVRATEGASYPPDGRVKTACFTLTRAFTPRRVLP